MQSMRRFGAMLLILFFGIIIGNYGLQTALLIFFTFVCIMVCDVG